MLLIKIKPMNRFLLSIFLIAIAIPTMAQLESKNIVFIEAFGTVGDYSMNYERLLLNKELFHIGLGVGFSITSREDIYVSDYVFPVSLSLIHKLAKNNYFQFRMFLVSDFHKELDYSECPLGAPSGSYCTEEVLSTNHSCGIGIGYRYQPNEEGLYLSAMVQKRFLIENPKLQDYLSLGVGYAF